MYKLFKTPTFENDLDSLDQSVADRVVDKLKHLAENLELARSVKYLPDDLQGLKKYRVGDWRVFFWIDNNKKEIILYGVRHRSVSYKDF